MRRGRAAVRGAGFGGLVVFLLTLVGSPPAARAQDRQPGRPRVVPGDDIDLGTAVAPHRETHLGPLSASLGLADRVQVGTRLLPWLVGAIAPGSVVPNLYAKGLLFRRGRWSGALETALFYAKLDDLDRDGLNVRAWIWPTRALVGLDWVRRFSTTLELTGVYTAVAADSLADTDTRVEGVALARTAYAGVLPRYRLLRWLSIWGRVRVLLGHSPVVARGRIQLSGTTRVELEARADAAELTSGVAAVAGLHFHWPFLSLTAAGGYGTWFLPWIYLPVGESTAIGELDVYFRF